MSWISVLLGIFAGLLIYIIYLVVITLIKKRKDKKNSNDIEK